MEDVMSMIMALTPEQRKEAKAILNRMSDEAVIQIPHRAEDLLAVLCGLTGRRMNLRSRDSEVVWAKAMVAYRMMEEGYTLAEIGRQLGKDHSTVIHYRHKMQDALSLPQAYQDILPLWYEFKTRIENDIHERPDGDALQV